MPAVSIDLGSIEVSNKHSFSSLTLSSSFSIVLPPEWPETTTAAELCDASSAGDIWISKAGSCLVEVLTLVGGKISGDYGFDGDSTFLELVADCAIWEDIGLELRTRHVIPDESPVESRSQRTYYLHHPDLSSNMVAPKHIPIARFQGLRIEVNFRPETAGPETQTNSQGISQGAPESQRSHTYSLRRNPRPTPRALAAQEDSELSNSGTARSTMALIPTQRGGGAEMSVLLETALRKMVGIRGATPGIRVRKRDGSPSLVDIAPAVWNLRYLQSLTAHARVIPVLAEGIARLSSSRSSTLREKVARLRLPEIRPGSSTNQHNSEGSVEEGVKSRLWTLCQTTIHADPIAKGSTRRNLDSALNESQQLEESNRAWQDERQYLETLASQGSYADNQDSYSGRYFGQHAFSELHPGVYEQREQYGHIVERDSAHDMSEELAEQLLMAYNPSGLSPHVDEWEQNSNYRNLRDVPEMARFGSLGHHADYLLDQNAAVPRVSADEVDGSADESEGGYFYVDGQGNYYQIDRQCLENKGPGWEASPSLNMPTDNHSAGQVASTDAR